MIGRACDKRCIVCRKLTVAKSAAAAACQRLDSVEAVAHNPQRMISCVGDVSDGSRREGS
jgi:hypothetical protein